MRMVNPVFHNKFLYEYMLKKGLTVSIFNISTFPKVFLLVFASSNEDLSKNT